MPPVPTIPRTAISAIMADLDAAKPPQVSCREAVKEMADSIRAARTRGCSDDAILKILEEHGIKISASTLRAYLSESAPKTKPPRKASAIEAASALNTATAETATRDDVLVATDDVPDPTSSA